MASTYVIHWQDKRLIGQHLLIGDEAACVRAIMAGDPFTADLVTKIEWYDTDEAFSREISLEDVARVVANRAQIEEWNGGGGITPAVRNFIHSHAGLAWARGLKILDRSLAA